MLCNVDTTPARLKDVIVLDPRTPTPVAQAARLCGPVPSPGSIFGWLPVWWSRVAFPGKAETPDVWCWRSFLVIFLIPAALLYPCMSFPLFEPDEGRYAQIAREMLGDALSAFVRGDGPTGRAVCARDDQVDALNDSMFRILITHMAEDPHTIGAAMELFLVSRNLERVADLATNIAEDVVFLVEGKTIKHHAEERQAASQK